jgi:N-acetylglucosaminyl-diphospho-decaprenol L-rhamnosyltransferase
MPGIEAMDLSIIIVSYNTVDQIAGCLHSILAHDGINCEIFVIDNASADGSLAFIKQYFPSVRLFANKKNRGFAAANNQVLNLCRGRFIFFLNPDTIVQPNAFAEAISFMDRSPQVGLAGTKIINPDRSIQESVSYRYPGEKYTTGELSGLQGAIACVLGASMIARPAIIKKIGGFDEDFFIYGEDQDICLRIRRLGYEIGYIDKAEVVHSGGKSERANTSAEVWRKKIRAEHLFYRKHYLRENIQKINRADLFKARWRILTLNIAMPLTKNREKAREKLIKYEVILQELFHAAE